MLYGLKSLRIWSSTLRGMVTTLRGEDAKNLRRGFWRVWWCAVALLRGGMGSVAISVALPRCRARLYEEAMPEH
jgi:hypothetical protein